MRKEPSGIITLKSRSDLVNEIVSAETGVSLNKLKAGHISQSELPLVQKALKRISASKVYIEKMSDPTLNKIKATLLQARREKNIKLVILDVFLDILINGVRSLIGRLTLFADLIAY